MTSKFASPPIAVLQLITRFIVGGAQENTIFTAAMLDKSRYRVQIVAGPQTGSEGSLIQEIYDRGLALTILPNLLRQVSPLNDLIALWRLVQIIKEGDYHIVHTHSSKAGILGRLAARLANTPVVIHTIHGWSFHDYMSPLSRQMYILLERWMASFSDALIAVTQKDVQKGLAAGIGRPDQYHLIRSSIPLDEFQPNQFVQREIRQELGIPLDDLVIGNVGRFSDQKNPLDWIYVAAKVVQTCPDTSFLLVGDGPKRKEVEAEIQRLGIQQKIILTGIRRDVARMLAAMDIFLLTSLWEGLPRVIPQAMAMQLPVIANRADGIAEVIVDGVSGYLCSPGDIDQASQYCVDLALQPSHRLEMGRNGRAIALKEFDLSKMISDIESLYDQLASRKL